MLIDVNRMTMSLVQSLFELETNQETLESIKTFILKRLMFRVEKILERNQIVKGTKNS